MRPITGSIVALVTPMHEDQRIDTDALRRLVDWHVEEGTQCLAVVGTTGESPTVSVEEHCEVIRVAVEQARGRIPVMAGTGGNSTAEAIALARYALKVGADCTLSVVPYYNKPSQEGIYRHFKAIAEAVDIPMVLYNVPSRTVADMQTETTLRLAGVPGIVGVKDATGDIARGSSILRLAPPGFAVYSGNDDSAVALMLLGGHGSISVTANVAPRAVQALCTAALEGNAREAARLQMRLLGLHQALFVEPSPAPTKWALSRLGRCGATVRLPITPLTESGQAVVSAALGEAGLA
jgi:4-hydroxy-tetrahydrodipicolinate synthase